MLLKYLLLNASPRALLNEIIAAIKTGRTFYLYDDSLCIRPIKVSFNDYDGQDESGRFHHYRVYHVDIDVIGWVNSTSHIIIELPDDTLQLVLREGPSPNTNYIPSEELWAHTTRIMDLYWPYFGNSYTLAEKLITEVKLCHNCNNALNTPRPQSASKTTTSCPQCGNENTYHASAEA